MRDDVVEAVHRDGDVAATTSTSVTANTTASSSSSSSITLCTFAKLCALVFGGLTMPVMGIPRADDTTSHSNAPYPYKYKKIAVVRQTLDS
jgi:hypothetical protein